MRESARAIASRGEAVAEVAVEAGPDSDSPIQPSEPVAGPIHTIFLLVVLSVVAFLGYLSTHQTAGARPPHRLFFYLTTIGWEWLLVGYIYWGLRRRGKSFRNIAGNSWKSMGSFLLDFAIAFGFWIAAIVILAIVAAATHTAGMSEAARKLAPHGTLESVLWVALSITAGFCEETIFRGYLQRQFVAWTHSAPVGVVLSAAMFGAGHVYQGGKATIAIGVYGLMFGILAEARKNLRPGIMVHAWHDSLTGLFIRFVPVK